MFEIRDPIHRNITFSEREKRVIDHPYIQRLRYVRQLGLSYMVYPGAIHDRFSHALGAMHVAGRIWTGIRQTSGEVLAAHFSPEDLAYFHQILRFAGLMHDLGHPPFSHVSEKFMPPFSALKVPQGWFAEPGRKTKASHEDYSIVLVGALAAEENSPLGMDEAQDVASLIHHGVVPSASWEERFGPKEGGKGGIHRLLRSLISGELDCDRMDYLLRDAYYSGVAYGMHDIDHLLVNLGVIDMPEKGLTLTIDATAVRAFEDFLLARYHMFLQVYLHKTTLAFDYFLEQALYAGEFPLTMPGDAQGYSQLRDSTLIERLFTAAADPKNEWSRRLTERRPSKMVMAASNAKMEDRDLMAKLIAALKEEDVPFFEMTSRQYLSKTNVHGPSSAMLVRRKMFGKFVYEPIEQYSALLNKYNEVIDMSNLYVLPEYYNRAKGVIAKMVG